MFDFATMFDHNDFIGKIDNYFEWNVIIGGSLESP